MSHPSCMSLYLWRMCSVFLNYELNISSYAQAWGGRKGPGGESKLGGRVVLSALLAALQVSNRTKLLVLDGGGSRNAIQLARTLRGVGLSRAYVVEVRASCLRSPKWLTCALNNVSRRQL